ncbi:MAG TPA: NAD-dependent deacylase [Anaerolineales bacterium]|nr:NAD-dependent deacylase [Anaerolineales bacterium]
MAEMIQLSPATQTDIRDAADIIRGCRQGVVLTGAGLSTPSGIPDFRSTNSGLWERFDPAEVASLSTFRYHPEKFFAWIRPLVAQMAVAQPNIAHQSLAFLETKGYLKTTITQNIDGLHQKAGAKNVLEVHGSLETLTCVKCFSKLGSADYIAPLIEAGEIPHCPTCGGILKPNLILFGEQLPSRTWLTAQEACRKADLMIIAGSSLEVLPVAGLPMRALENGAHLIIINQTQTYLDLRADVVFREDVLDILPRIVKEVACD